MYRIVCFNICVNYLYYFCDCNLWYIINKWWFNQIICFWLIFFFVTYIIKDVVTMSLFIFHDISLEIHDTSLEIYDT